MKPPTPRHKVRHKWELLAGVDSKNQNKVFNPNLPVLAVKWSKVFAAIRSFLPLRINAPHKFKSVEMIHFLKGNMSIPKTAILVMSKFKFSPRHSHVTLVGSRWREPAPLRAQTRVCRPHVPALKHWGNHHLYSSPLRSEHSPSQSHIKTSSSYTFCPAQEAHKHTRTSCARCARTAEETQDSYTPPTRHISLVAFFFFFPKKVGPLPGCHSLPRIPSSTFS